MIPYQYALRRRLMGSTKKYAVTIGGYKPGNTGCVSITAPDGSNISDWTTLYIPQGQKFSLLVSTTASGQDYKNAATITLNGKKVASCDTVYEYVINSDCLIIGKVTNMNIGGGSRYYYVGTIEITTS